MDKIAVVTGASGGIGRETARILREKGCVVYDLSRSDKPQDGITHIPCDVTDEGSVKAAADAVIEKSGGIDILVCCAGMGISGAVEFTDPKDSYRQMDGQSRPRRFASYAPTPQRQAGDDLIRRGRNADPVPNMVLGKQGGDHLLCDGAL